MADEAVASGLMAHQKDEHDIWICKDCGWKYPNARPSPKIRKNHKKHCPGKAGAEAHAAGGSSDDASDDEHHSSVKGGDAPNQPAVGAPAPLLESKSRDIDFSVASVKEDGSSVPAPSEAAVVNGNAKEAPTPSAVAVDASHTGLMPHQKDEHDIWICKECGWKYPNAKPSPKIRKNHKKHCPGKGGPVPAGGSSDEASDDDHHSVPTPDAPAPAVQQAQEESTPTAEAPAEAPTSISREIDFAGIKESPSPVINDETSSTAVEPDADNGTTDSTLTPPLASQPASLEKADPEEAKKMEAVAPETTVVGGLMLHQKDEDDIWICKDCGWKYPNAKPSPKIRKNHKKKCTGKAPGGAATAGGSSDEASDDEHHLSSPAPAAPVQTPVAREELPPAAPVEVPSAVEPGKVDPAAASEVPGSVSREVDFAALKESSNPEVEKETTPASTVETTPAIAGPDSLREEPGKATPTEDAGAATLREVLDKETETQKDAAPKRLVSLKEAIDKESKKEMESATPTEPAAGSGGLMLHQKDKADIWVCKECGWKYPNAKPSPKIRNNHKKKCPGYAGSGAPVDGGSSDEASDDEHHSTTETAKDKDMKPSTAAETVAEVPDSQIASKEFSFDSAVQTSNATPASEAGVHATTEKREPAKVAETQEEATAGGGLMLHKKDENDIWLCKECGWKYPNGKPSAKIRRNHKKKCPKNNAAAKGTDGGSSDGSSSDNDKMKGGKCFPCL